MKKSYQLYCLSVAFTGLQINKNTGGKYMHLPHPAVNRKEKSCLFTKAILLFILCLSIYAKQRLIAATYTVARANNHPVSGIVSNGTGVINGGAANAYAGANESNCYRGALDIKATPSAAGTTIILKA